MLSLGEPRNKNNNMNTFNFFRKNKTKMSTIKDPSDLLDHLKDNDIITMEEYVSLIFKLLKFIISITTPYDLHVTVKTIKLAIKPLFLHFGKSTFNLMILTHLFVTILLFNFCFIMKNKALSARNTVYRALEFIENHGPEKVEKFWECVDQDHILEKYPQFSELLNILKTSQVKKTDVETGRSQNNNERNQAGQSSQGTKEQKVKSKGLEEILALIKNKKLLPITCGEEKALLIRKELSGKKLCIRRRKKLMTPVQFVKLCKKEKWKRSIKCHGKSLYFLITRGILKVT
ncbi:uncharacterized protein si:dkey-68o6.8 isoform X1 [Triplophysa dalaica]|uniref:uncharacterized protein si:dkey-68o6.8 isoform X1 n=1 Tax=Triplophysa dalaica TaxID=1582913 RepID=UPI0024E03027|nr:uncharacterized protein si:dkey-68o6.8 isoform X1 [Triplophysa dalaica]